MGVALLFSLKLEVPRCRCLEVEDPRIGFSFFRRAWRNPELVGVSVARVLVVFLFSEFLMDLL